MAGYCLKNGKIQDAFSEDVAGVQPAAIFHLNAQGEMEATDQVPDLSEGEGLLMYAGELYVESLEIQVEFLKAANAERWLEALILRHVERVRQVDPGLWIHAEIREVSA